MLRRCACLLLALSLLTVSALSLADASGTDLPVEPSSPVEDPSGGTGEPSGGTGEPSGGTDDPSGPADDPSGSTDDPSGPTDDPSGGPDDPSGPTDDPSGGPNDPSGPTDDPPAQTVTVSVSGGVESPEKPGHWTVDLTGQDALTFTWTGTDAQGWTVRLAILSEVHAPSSRWSVPTDRLQNGATTFTVRSVSDPSAAASIEVVITGVPDGTGDPGGAATETDLPDAGEGADTPAEQPGAGAPAGGRQWGGFSRRGRSGSGAQKPSVVPGKALTTTHARGTGDLTVYDTADLSAPMDGISVLDLNGLTIEVSGGTFSSRLDGETLTLTGEAGAAWTLSQGALRLLGRSGVTSLVLVSGEETAQLDTGLEFTGYTYGTLRAKGLVSADFVLTVEGAAVGVSAGGRDYTLNGTELQ